MAQAGFTPISIYYSSTASAVPLAANLAFGELALNTLDGKLYFKNSVGVVTLLSSSTIAGGEFTTLSYSTSFTGNGPATITDNSSSAALRITQTGSGNALLVEDSANPDATPFVVDQNGAVGIGGTPSAGVNLYNTRDLSGAVTAFGTSTASTVRSSVTTAAYGFQSLIATESAAFTLPTLVHYSAAQSTFANTGVTTQVGYSAGSTLIGATNNWGFQGNIPAGTNRYNLYMSGTADNYLAGRLSIGAVSPSNVIVGNLSNITGTLTVANSSINQIQSSSTVSATVYSTSLSTQAASFTLPILNHYSASQGTIGAGSSITSQVGFLAGSTNIGATFNYGLLASDTAAVTAGKTAYGVYSNVNIATGGGTAYGFYAGGTAPNVFNGDVQTSSQNGGQLAGFRNRLLNPQIVIQQRGASISITNSTPVYGPDRWRVGITSGTSVSATATLTPSDTPSGRASSLTGTWTTGKPYWAQRIEAYNIVDVINKPITVSGYIVFPSGVTDSLSVVISTAGAFDDFSGVTVIATNTTTSIIGSGVATFWTTTFTAAQMSASAIANGMQVEIFKTSAITHGTSTQYSLSCVQLEVGLTSTPLEIRPYGLEITMCQRYYEKSFPVTTSPTQNLGLGGSGAQRFIAGKATTGTQTAYVKYSVPKRDTPITVTLFNPSAANAQVRDSTAATDCSASSVPVNSNNGFTIVCTGSATTAVGNALDFAWTSSAEL